MSRSSIVVVLASLLLAACGSRAESADSEQPVKTGTPVPGLDGGGSDRTADAGAGALDAGGGPVLVVEPDQGMTPIYDLISSATKTLDMTMYELDDTTATALLTKAAASGVTVRVILDQNLEMMTNQTAYDALGANGVQVHWANPTYAVTHQKTITVDGTTSAIMTLNFSSTDYPTSRDFAVITTDAADVAAIETVFADDFTNAAITPPTGDDLVWSPTNALVSLVGLINGATTTLLVENEEMSDSQIVDALTRAAARGVDVKVAMEASKSYATEFATLVNAGVKLATYSHAALYIHAKVILADYGTNAARVYIGSENFSVSSLTANRELGLITANSGIMAGIETTLTSDFDGGTTYVVPVGGDL